MGQDFDTDEVIIGYEDRFVGIMETPFGKFDREITSESFVPLHRIVYFKYQDKIVWDRRDKTDLIFNKNL